MSLTKEQLMNTYIVNDFGVLRDAYASACIDAGIQAYTNSTLTQEVHKYLEVYRGELMSSNRAEDSNKQLHLSDLISLENSKVYTTDHEVVRMYGELCGTTPNMDHDRYNSECYCEEYGEVSSLHPNYYDDKEWHEITKAQVRALYREKFGGLPYVEGQIKDSLDKMAAKLGAPLKPAPKPRTRTEYEHVGYHMAHEAMHEHEVIAPLYVHGDFGFEVASKVDIANGYAKQLYRKQEVDVDWRDEIEYKFSFFESSKKNKSVHLNTRNSIDEEHFLEMCRFVLRAKGEIE